MNKRSSPHLAAVLQALLVTFLWSTSWVIIKFSLAEIPPVTFAGLRYTLAFLCLLPIAARAGHLRVLRRLTGRSWMLVFLLGLLYYAVAQGTQFVGLFYLPALTVSLLLSFTPIVVALLGIALLAERPTVMQWGGVALYLVGILLYFYPVAIPEGEVLGMVIVLVGTLANAGSSVLGRYLNREKTLHPLALTTASMGIGSIILLFAGVATQGLPPLSAANWAAIVWLAFVNTAFAFTLWNHTLRTLSAVESSIINNTMLVQIAILAWLFLGERPDEKELAGMALVVAATLLVQLRKTSYQRATVSLQQEKESGNL